MIISCVFVCRIYVKNMFKPNIQRNQECIVKASWKIMGKWSNNNKAFIPHILMKLLQKGKIMRTFLRNDNSHLITEADDVFSAFIKPFRGKFP